MERPFRKTVANKLLAGECARVCVFGVFDKMVDAWPKRAKEGANAEAVA